MTFEIKRLDARCWAVLDESDAAVFSGSLESCQQWLDVRENRTQSALLSRTLHSILQLITLGRFQPKNH